MRGDADNVLCVSIHNDPGLSGVNEFACKNHGKSRKMKFRYSELSDKKCVSNYIPCNYVPS